MTTEYDLQCATCGGPLSRTTVPSHSLDISTAAEAVPVAECAQCGERYFPSETLDRL